MTAIAKRVVFTMGGKGGVGKTGVMVALAEWFEANEIPATLLDLDTENKARGSLQHFFNGRVTKVNIHTPAGLDAFVDHLDGGTPIILADMGAGAGQVAADWFEAMYEDVAATGVRFTAVGVVTPDPASVESVLAWANRLQERVDYVIVENATSALADFTYWKSTEQANRFREAFAPEILQMEFRLAELENPVRQHGIQLGQVADRKADVDELKRASLVMRAQSYAQRHLEHSDYYDEGRRVQGEWYGQGAELLGLRGEVTREQFEAVREGLHPETGEFLRPRHSADRIDANGSEQSKGRSLYDLTFSAPKSVSIQALVGGDERLIDAHDKAVREALAEAESYAATRVRLNGANEDRATANWIVAAYRHDTSRELDPQLHTHAVTANLTYDGVEGRWKALQASGLYERRAYLTEVYRNALAREVFGLGYEIETRRDSKGRDHGFEICGVSDELLEKYSVRSAQRDAAIERFTVDHGRQPTNNEVAVLVRESRADKLTEISTERLRKLQQARLFPEEGRALKKLHKKSLKRTRHTSPEPFQEAESLQHAKEHLFERSSVARQHELMTEALRHGRGKIDRRQLRSALELEQLQGSLIGAGNNLATRAMRRAVREALERNTPRAASVEFLLRQSNRATPLPLDLRRHPQAESVEVHPHDLEAYDELAQRRDDEPES